MPIIRQMMKKLLMAGPRWKTPMQQKSRRQKRMLPELKVNHRNPHLEVSNVPAVPCSATFLPCQSCFVLGRAGPIYLTCLVVPGFNRAMPFLIMP